jgi:hypothetical protein
MTVLKKHSCHYPKLFTSTSSIVYSGDVTIEFPIVFVFTSISHSSHFHIASNSLELSMPEMVHAYGRVVDIYAKCSVDHALKHFVLHRPFRWFLNRRQCFGDAVLNEPNITCSDEFKNLGDSALSLAEAQATLPTDWGLHAATPRSALFPQQHQIASLI